MPVATGQRLALAKRSSRARIWQAMRVLRRFDAPTLAATADVILPTVDGYLYPLARAGYLRRLRPRRYHQPLGHSQWVLVRDSGPQNPRLTHRGSQVYDPNTGAVIALREVAP